MNDTTQGETLRDWRTEQGWTQGQAAEWWGCCLRTWGRWETDATPIPRPLVLALRRIAASV